MVAIRIPGPESIATVPVGKELDLRPRASAAAFGGDIAKAQVEAAGDLAKLGESTQKMGAVLGAIGGKLKAERQGAEDNTYANTFQTEYEPRARQEWEAAKQKYPNGGDGFTAELNDRLSQAEQDTTNSLATRFDPSQAAINRTQSHATAVRTNYLVSGETYAHNQRVASLSAQNDQNAENIAAQTLETGDVEGGLARVGQTLEAQRGLIPADQFRVKEKQYQQTVIDAGISNAIKTGDYEKARVLRDRYYAPVPTPTGGTSKSNLSADFAPRVDNLQQILRDEYGLETDIGSGGRSGAEQAKLYAQGRTIPGQIVTYAPPGSSYHNYGAAVDIKPTNMSDEQAGKIVGQAIAAHPELGLAWGGNFKNLHDPLHVQSSTPLAELRKGGAIVGPASADVGKALKWDNAITSASDVERRTLTGTLKDDLASTQETGVGNASLTYEGVARTLGPPAADAWVAARGHAQNFWALTQDFYALPDTQIIDRLDTLRPKPGAPDYIAQSKLFADAVDKADAIRKARVDDPAMSVSPDPEVKNAAATADFSKPETVKPLITARYAAQERAGIPEDYRSPITKNEALALSKPLQQALPGEERDALKEMAQNFQNLFGDDADDAFAFAIRARKLDASVTKEAARVSRKLGLGQPISREELRAADQSTEIAQARRTMTGPPPEVGMMPDVYTPSVAPSPPPASAPTAASLTNIAPAGAITDLRQNPDLAADFDRKYGKGAAQKILSVYPPARQTAPPPSPAADLTGPWTPQTDQTGAFMGFSQENAIRIQRRAGQAASVIMGKRVYTVKRDEGGRMTGIEEQ